MNVSFTDKKYFIYPKGKIFGVHIRYVKIRRAMALEWFTIKQSEMLYKGEEHFDNEHAQEAPLDLWHPILISPTGALEKEMATHSSVLAWRISWTEEPGRLQQSMGSQSQT